MCLSLGTIPYSNFQCLTCCRRTATGVQTGRHCPCIQVRRSGACNSRPISLLPIVSKLLEKIVSAQLKLSWPATVFFPKSSLLTVPTTQLKMPGSCIYCESLSAGERLWKGTGLVFVDLSKAFDRVKHQALINLLSGIGICDTALKWIAGKPPKWPTSAGNRFSSQSACSRGVPQGSALALALFSSHFMYETCHHVLMLKC